MQTSKEIKNTKNALAMYKHLAKEPELPESLIVAMMANAAVESAGTFDYTIKQHKRVAPAFGVFQYDPRGSGMGKLYKQYLEHVNKEDSLETQLDMMIDILLRVWKPGVEYIGSGNVLKVFRASEMSDDEATRAFSDFILRPGKPHMERRLAAVPEVVALIQKEKEMNV